MAAAGPSSLSQKFPEKYGVVEQIFDVPAKLGGMREADG